MCELASWIPNAVAVTLRSETAPPVVEWLTTIRLTIEEYDPLVTVAPLDPDPETADCKFDEILSQLGKEIFKLNEYQRNLAPPDKEVSLSILNIFDECLEHIPEEKPMKYSESECESVPDVTVVTSTPASVKVDVNNKSTNLVKGTPIPPRRARLKTAYDISITDMDSNNHDSESESEKSESTCWSYKECSSDDNESNVYAAAWEQSTGYHNSDEILRRVLSQHHATVSRLSFDTANDFIPDSYSVYSLHEVGECKDRCVDSGSVAMTPDRPTDDGGYEPVRDAITDENIYEEIEYGYSYTDEGCSCGGGSVEMESISVSASSEGVGRESPLYANLRDHDAYAIPPDVIHWKNSLMDPFYNEDEEDEWITPEECAVYTRDQRPPLVIPRITQYRPPRQRLPSTGHGYLEEDIQEQGPLRARGFMQRNNWSPTSERCREDLDLGYAKATSDSPPIVRINKRLGGSTENLLASNARRPSYLQLPASSSGDSLDVEIRDRQTAYSRNRKSRSMMTPKNRIRSPVPAPRLTMQHPPEMTIMMDGPVRRTKFLEGTKKVKKNWVDCYMVLTPSALVFYKDQRSYYSPKISKPGTPPSPSSPHIELKLPLSNAFVNECTAKHTRRYTRSIMLVVGNDQFLIQDDTEDKAKMWLEYIRKVIYTLYSRDKLGDSPPPAYQSSNTDLESLGRTPPAARHMRNKQKAGGDSNEDLSDSAEISIQKSRSRLRQFFTKRPAMEQLIKRGIYKDEPVFGRNLEEVCPTTSPRVPEFVEACVREIESSDENMCTDGLYRASGNLSQVQKIRLEVDQNKMAVIKNNTDIHVLTGSLKLFFRELKEPLIPCNMFDRVLSACSIKPREARIKEFREIVQKLPECNRDTLKFLLSHLLRVTQRAEQNRMHTANLAIVFGPTLLWAPAEQAHNIAVDCIQQNNVVDILLTEFKEIFPENGSKGKKKA